MDSSDQHEHTKQQQEEKMKEYEPMIWIVLLFLYLFSVWRNRDPITDRPLLRTWDGNPSVCYLFRKKNSIADSIRNDLYQKKEKKKQ